MAHPKGEKDGSRKFFRLAAVAASAVQATVFLSFPASAKSAIDVVEPGHLIAVTESDGVKTDQFGAWRQGHNGLRCRRPFMLTIMALISRSSAQIFALEAHRRRTRPSCEEHCHDWCIQLTLRKRR